MKTIRLVRLCENEGATLGALIIDGLPFCATLEPAWADNRKNESCIPAGSYICEAYQSERFGQTWEIKNVSGRSAICFHIGNFKHDTRGCILIGASWRRIGPNVALSDSKKKMNRLRERLKGDSKFLLEVFECVRLNGSP